MREVSKIQLSSRHQSSVCQLSMCLFLPFSLAFYTCTAYIPVDFYASWFLFCRVRAHVLILSSLTIRSAVGRSSNGDAVRCYGLKGHPLLFSLFFFSLLFCLVSSSLLVYLCIFLCRVLSVFFLHILLYSVALLPSSFPFHCSLPLLFLFNSLHLSSSLCISLPLTCSLFLSFPLSSSLLLLIPLSSSRLLSSLLSPSLFIFILFSFTLSVASSLCSFRFLSRVLFRRMSPYRFRSRCLSFWLPAYPILPVFGYSPRTGRLLNAPIFLENPPRLSVDHLLFILVRSLLTHAFFFSFSFLIISYFSPPLLSMDSFIRTRTTKMPSCMLR